MAVAIPIIMGAMGVAAEVVAAVSIVGAVTGVNEKINQAAGKVFGEDLVQAFSVVGSVFNLGSSLADAGSLASEFGSGAANAVASAPDFNPMDLRLAESGAAMTAADTAASAGLAMGGVGTETALAQATAANMPAPNAIVPPAPRTPVAGEAPTQPGVLKLVGEGVDGAGKWWSGLSPTTKQILGYGTIGLMQGYQQGKALEDAKQEREYVRLHERTGSGLRYGDNYVYQPASPVRRK